MPVRKRRDRRSPRAEFEVTAAIAEAFRAYVASERLGDGEWEEHWALHDLLVEAGALDLPWISPCCYHPRLQVRWDVLPGAVAVWRRLSVG